MKLEALRSIYQEMRNYNMERYKFIINYNAETSFEVIFFIDESPFILTFGLKAHNLYFEVPVERGFNVRVVLENEVYKKLSSILSHKSFVGRSTPFKPSSFFENFDRMIPKHFNPKSIPSIYEIAQHRVVEEKEKVYFMGWKDNNITNERVREQNLKKTRLLLSEEAYKRSKQKNMSSRWTDNVKFEQKYHLPR